MSLSSLVADKGIYLMVAIATLMTFTHLRGTHLSGRVREITKELLYETSKLTQDDSFKRRYEASVRWQVEEFVRRHKKMSGAFIMLTGSLVLTLFAILLCSDGSNNGASSIAGLTLACLGGVSFFFAVFLLNKEFLAGTDTLKKHVSSVLD